MLLKGRLIQTLPTISGTSKTGNQWTKATVIIDTNPTGQYPNKVAVSSFREAQALSAIPVLTDVELDVDIESREYNGRWYTEVLAFRIISQAPAPTDAPVANIPAPAPVAETAASVETLPF